ncbi:MAG TPA: hypothetical protein VH062_15860 [Polyangiaceae bacterium]|nr:hypothetical protein [Polyangiaceae bacterium]
MRTALDGDAEAVETALFGLVLRVALASTLAPGRLTAATLAASLETTEQWLRQAGVASPFLVGAPPSGLVEPACLTGWLDSPALDALLGALAAPDGRVEHVRIGTTYEELLSLRIRRLTGDALALAPDGAWVEACAVLAEPAALRSKWVQRSMGIPKGAVARLAPALARAADEPSMLDALAPLAQRGQSTAAKGALVVDASLDRRRSGSHYTPETLADAVLARTFAPLVEGASSARILALRVCDPAMGTGAFLERAARRLAPALEAAWAREGHDAGDNPARAALRAVVGGCLYGVDRDAVATDLARARLAALASDGDAPPDLSHRPAVGDAPVDLSHRLKVGDALIGRIDSTPRSTELFPSLDGIARFPSFDWVEHFPEVFVGGAKGFDACVGNPPWVAYVGRAAQPLEPALSRHYEETNPAFHGYRTLHGLFVRRAAELVAPGGRVGLVLPTSVADLAGYAPTRDAHDALCDVDAELVDFGDGAFAGVFQPCMALTSTRRRDGTRREPRKNGIWPLKRSDIDAVVTRLLERLDALPKLPGELFGERGFQTTGDDLAHLRKLERPTPPFVLPIREGSDISEFRTSAPRTFLAPEGLRGRLRDAAAFRSVGVLIRQTARYPIASLSDGEPFRNSILAGFPGGGWTAPALAAYLNSSVVRFFHYTRHRDARQGMPQLKIGHLRALPAIDDATTRDALHAVGERLGRENAGIGPEHREALDDTVAGALGLDDAERAAVAAWASANPLPKARSVPLRVTSSSHEKPHQS